MTARVPTPDLHPDRGFDPGTGCLCAEAQADGVPCPELGRDCEDCERAVRRADDYRGSAQASS